jgi:nitroreductase
MTPKTHITLVSVLAILLLAPPLWADLELPAPQTAGGMGLFDALKKRASVPGAELGIGKVSLEELSTVLWAASGLNRGETGWTVPMARGLEPYVAIHVAGEEGLFLYDWKAHALVELSRENVKGSLASQSFVGKGSYVLIFSSLPGVLAKLPEREAADEYSAVLTGAMSQDVYLAAAALRLSTRYIHQMRVGRVREVLGLPEGARPIALMPLGK